MRIVITGADGFIGKNLRCRLRECGYTDIVGVTEDTSQGSLLESLASADFVFHLAGVNRPQSIDEFVAGNVGFTSRLCEALGCGKSRAPILFSSSIQASLDNPYGRSKLAAEGVLQEYGARTGTPVHIVRLPNVFGKWALPNYNSAVATFCYNISRGLPINVIDPSAQLLLAYIDDVVEAFISVLPSPSLGGGYGEVAPIYHTRVGEVAEILLGFAESRQTLFCDGVGVGLRRALYATYVSYLPEGNFSYELKRHVDPRGEFVEMFKTSVSGQVSYFTAHPGVTRGDHYHHTKTEKFLVIRGTAQFSFRQIISGEAHSFTVRGEDSRVVESVPGWAHSIRNVGLEELIVMLWANEVFDAGKPDTIPMKAEV